MGKIELKEILCRLCLNIVSDDNFIVVDETIGEVLNVLLLKWSVQEKDESVICKTCSEKMFAAFRFKAICTDTEDSIFPYVSPGNVTPVDLNEIYLKIRGKEHLMAIMEGELICRLCMEVVTCRCIPLKEVNIDVTCKYIPEVNFNSIKKPVICKVCLDSLDTHNKFLENCLDVEKKNQKSCGNKTVDNMFNINGGDNGYHTEALHKSSLKYQELRHRNSSKVLLHKCDKCYFETKQKKYLFRHQLIHKRISEVKMYKCDICDFETKYRKSQVRHQLTHRDASEVQMYKYDMCDFETKLENKLVVHQQQNKHISKVQVR